MDSTKLLHPFTFYLSTALAIFRYLQTGFFRLKRIPIFFTIVDTVISLYFRLCGLSPFTIDLDDQTTMHFWTSNHRRFNKPNLVMIHGYGGDARWQFVYQVGSLSQNFNLYVPDLLFFGKSSSKRSGRTDTFQARCLADCLKRLGVDRFSVYSISYGGFVAYRIAEIFPEEVEKVVIVSSGVGSSDDQIEEQIKKIGRDPAAVLLPEHPQDLRFLVNLSVYKCKPLRWLPDIFLQEFINVGSVQTNYIILCLTDACLLEYGFVDN